MAELRIEGDELVLRLSRAETVESAHRDQRAPLSAARVARLGLRERA